MVKISFSDEKTQIKQYETGGIYDGEFLNGKQHGKGKYSLPNGYYYEGEWKEGRTGERRRGRGLRKILEQTCRRGHARRATDCVKF